MSVSRRPKKIKPLNPEEQPPIFKYIGSGDNSPQSNKRRRSTGEKPIAKKRVDSIGGTPISDFQDPRTPESTETDMASNNLMLEEIKKMEARLTANINKQG